MKLCRVYRFRLEPTASQTNGLYRLSGARRWVYNWALTRRKAHFQETGKSLSVAHLSKGLTTLKAQPETAWLKEADSQLLQQSVQDLDTAFANFFAKRGGFPKFASKKKGHFSFRIPQRVRVENGKVYCPKIGWIRLRQSQEIDGQTKSATFKRDACGNWFVTLTTEFEMPEFEMPEFEMPEFEMPDTALPEPVNPVGIDAGLKDFVTLSGPSVAPSGESVAAPKFFRRLEKKLAKAQRKLGRAQVGSHRRQKAKLRVAKVHRKVAYCRADFVHKVTSDLVKRFDHIGIEDLNVKALAKTKLRGHAKSVHDAALGELRRQLEYKCLWHRRHLVKVSRWFASSKLCGQCGAVNAALTLSDRAWLCGCGAFHQRDLNAARNILDESLKLAAGQADNQNARGADVRPCT